jgi:glucose/arabinose dehydrogenase
MSLTKQARCARRIIIIVICGLLVVITLVTFYQQIPMILQSPTIHDKSYINGLKRIGNLIPQNETLATIGSYPQLSYFTDHKVKIPMVDTEKSLVEFMWKINSSYLLVPEDISGAKDVKPPILIQLVEKPFEKVFDYFNDVSEVQPHKKGIMWLIKKKIFNNLFEEIFAFKTEASMLHLYRLRSNVTTDNLSLVTNTVPTSPNLNDKNLHVEMVANGLSLPTSMTFIGPNDILVLEKNTGLVKRVKNGTILPGSVLDVSVANDGEKGLLGIDAVRIANSTTKFHVFLYYTASSVDGGIAIGNKLSKYTLDIDPKFDSSHGRITFSAVLLILPSALTHNGGKVIIGPDSNVYTVIGDLSQSGEREGNTQAQNLETGPSPDGTGGIVRVTQDGKSVGNGTISSSGSLLNMYYSYGVRDSFGLDFDPLTGILWDTENGPSSNDEINAVLPGFNSGWTDIMGFAPKGFSFSKLANFGGLGKYREPEFIWAHTVAPTALKFLRSSKLGAEYQNDMFVADFNKGRIYNFNLNSARTELNLTGVLADKVANTHLELQHVIFGEGFGGISDLKVGPSDGFLYVLSMSNGIIYKIVPESETTTSSNTSSQSEASTELIVGSLNSNDMPNQINLHTIEG